MGPRGRVDALRREQACRLYVQISYTEFHPNGTSADRHLLTPLSTEYLTLRRFSRNSLSPEQHYVEIRFAEFAQFAQNIRTARI